MDGAVDALLLAGGSGRRMGRAAGGRNKTLLPLAGEPVLCHSLRTLMSCSFLRRIVIVHRAEDSAEIRSLLPPGFLEVKGAMVEGGSERFDSVYNGLEFLAGDAPEIVAIHDSARPFATIEMVYESVRLAGEHGASTVAVPLSDTLKRGDGRFLHETLPRHELYRIQTPQTFRYDLIWQAHQQLRQNPDPTVTDDCMLLERKGIPIAYVRGDETNLKITTPLDFLIAESILASR